MKAFPKTASENSHGWSASQEGMDLRDYFAAKAMNNLQHCSHPKDVAREAYKIADAMMKAREPEDNSHEVIAEALTRLKEENNHNACGDPHCGICV